MFSEGENVHTYVLEDGTLRFAFVSTTEREENGVPAEAWQRLLYDTATFTPADAEGLAAGRGGAARSTVSVAERRMPTPLPSSGDGQQLRGLPAPLRRWPLKSTPAAVGQPGRLGGEATDRASQVVSRRGSPPAR